MSLKWEAQFLNYFISVLSFSMGRNKNIIGGISFKNNLLAS